MVSAGLEEMEIYASRLEITQNILGGTFLDVRWRGFEVDQMVQMDLMDQIDPMDQVDQMVQMDQMGRVSGEAIIAHSRTRPSLRSDDREAFAGGGAFASPRPSLLSDWLGNT